jgi:hypothetical protein
MSSWKERAERSAADMLASAASAASTDDRVTTCAVRQSGDGSRRFFTENSVALGWLTGFSALMFMAVAAGASTARDMAVARVLIALLAVGGITICYRLIRMGIMVRGTRLTVRNLWRTWSVDAADIAWFAPSLRGVSFVHSGLLIKLVSTAQPRIRVVSVFGYAFLRGAKGGVAQSAELTTWLLDVRAGRPPRQRELIRAPAAKWSGRIGYTVLALVLAMTGAIVLAAVIDPSFGQ